MPGGGSHLASTDLQLVAPRSPAEDSGDLVPRSQLLQDLVEQFARNLLEHAADSGAPDGEWQVRVQTPGDLQIIVSVVAGTASEAVAGVDRLSAVLEQDLTALQDEMVEGGLPADRRATIQRPAGPTLTIEVNADALAEC